MRPRWSGAFIRFHAPLAFPSPCQPHARIWGHHTAGLSHCHPLAEAVEQQRGRRPDSSTDQVPSILEQRLRCEQSPPGGPPYLLGPTCNTVTLELMFLGCGRHLGTLAEGIPGKETRANGCPEQTQGSAGSLCLGQNVTVRVGNRGPTQGLQGLDFISAQCIGSLVLENRWNGAFK